MVRPDECGDSIQYPPFFSGCFCMGGPERGFSYRLPEWSNAVRLPWTVCLTHHPNLLIGEESPLRIHGEWTPFTTSKRSATSLRCSSMAFRVPSLSPRNRHSRIAL